MSKLNITYDEFITYTNNTGIRFIPWDCCKRGSKLGTGASLNVFDGTYEDNGVIQKAAFKSLKTSSTEETTESRRNIILRDIRQEIRIMGRLRGHSRIVQLLAVSFNDHTPILILELAKSNLEDYLQSEQAEWKTKLGFMYDIALGLEAIHKVKAVHGDLKASNVLVCDGDNGRMIAKISNFGYSSTDSSVQAGRILGYTPNFRSLECFDPELGDWNGKHTTDIYSYGLVVYQIADNGTVPFSDYSEEEINIMKKKGTELSVLMEHLPNDTPNEIRKIITATVKNIPSERSRLDEVKNTLKECAELDQIYSYEEAKIAFESLTQAGLKESIDIFEMNQLSIPLSLRTSIFREYQRLAAAGDMIAMQRLGRCWYLGFGTEKDYLKAVECYKISAEANNADAQNSLGRCYQYGLGITKDYTKAVEWYTKSAEAGNANAQDNIGRCYRNGYGVTQDNVKAVEWYTKGVESDNPSTQNSLGWCYQNGLGVTQDYIKAIEWYTKSAEAGNAYAQNNLGRCYKNGYGVTKDYVKAVEWFTKGAEAGNAYAIYNLASCYENGQGVTKDYIKAIDLYTKAVEAGNNDAPNDIERLRKLVENN